MDLEAEDVARGAFGGEQEEERIGEVSYSLSPECCFRGGRMNTTWIRTGASIYSVQEPSLRATTVKKVREMLQSTNLALCEVWRDVLATGQKKWCDGDRDWCKSKSI